MSDETFRDMRISDMSDSDLYNYWADTLDPRLSAEMSRRTTDRLLDAMCEKEFGRG